MNRNEGWSPTLAAATAGKSAQVSNAIMVIKLIASLASSSRICYWWRILVASQIKNKEKAAAVRSLGQFESFPVSELFAPGIVSY